MLGFVEEYLGATPDPRSLEYPFLGSSVQVLGVVLLYIGFVKKIGPKFMENRNPFNLKKTLIIYNALQVICNMYLVYGGTLLIIFHRISVGRCVQANPDHPEHFAKSIELNFVYTMLKYADFMDTIFIVLRKNYHQVTFLHFFHHLSVSLECTALFRYVPYGHITVVGVMNSFVHVVMYFYYMLCCIQPDMKKSIWWKKYITLLQMGQFVLMFLYLIYPWMNGENCGYPLKLLEILTLESLILLALFTNFYIKTYVMKKKEKKVK